MKHKVAELEGGALDLAVAKAEGLALEHANIGTGWMVVAADGLRFIGTGPESRRYSPSADSALGQAIIESERITAIPGNFMVGTPALARHPSGAIGEGPTPLIAAMRAYVASKLGDEVDL